MATTHAKLWCLIPLLASAACGSAAPGEDDPGVGDSTPRGTGYEDEVDASASPDAGADAPARPVDARPQTTSTRPPDTQDGGIPLADAGPGKRDGGPIAAGTTIGGCAGAGIACDDFESYTPGMALPRTAWRTAVSNATLSVDGTKAFSGKNSIHILTNLDAPGGAVGRTATITKTGGPLFPIANDNYYGRMMVWLQAMPQGGVHWNNVMSGGRVPNSDRTSSYDYGGMYAKIMAGYGESSPDGFIADCSRSSKRGVPEGRWFCMEWHFDGSADGMEYWIDGTPITDVSIVKKGSACVTGKNGGDGLWHAPLFSSLTIGWQNYQLSPIPIEMWLDDFAVDGKRVGCPPAP
jgi:hypothetical protein